MNISEQRITDHYEELLGVESERALMCVETDRANKRLETWASWRELKALACPKYEAVCPGYDKQEQGTWRHLDACNYTTLLHARIPHYRCQHLTFEGCWPCSGQQEARRFFKQWPGRAKRSNPQPIKSIVNTFKRHLEDVRTYFTQCITNASTGGLDPLIQSLKSAAPGFRKLSN